MNKPKPMPSYWSLFQEVTNLHGLLGKYQDENAKLRELLAELYEEQCDECDRWKYRGRMRELGAEVKPCLTD